MASAKRLPSGSWRVMLFVGYDASGKRIYKSFTAPTKKEAEYEAALFNMERKEKKTSGLTVKEAADQYIASIENVVSPWTVNTYRRITRNDLQPILSVPLSKLTQDEIQRFINAYSRTHSPKSCRSTHGFLSSVLKSVDPDIVLHTRLPKPTKTEISIPTEDNIRTLIGLADEQTRLAILISANFGLRRGEICALTWADVSGDKLTVNKALAQNDRNEWVLKAPKSVSGYRTMPIPPAVSARILAFRPEAAADADKLMHITPTELTKRFCILIKKSGIPHCRFHDLRHYNASVMLSLGIPDKYAMQRMGHATPVMLKRVYQHLMDEKEKEVADQMTAYMEQHEI